MSSICSVITLLDALCVSVMNFCWRSDDRKFAMRSLTTLLVLMIANAMTVATASAAPPADEDAMIAQNLAEMLRDARTVISNNQELINNPELGDKHLTGRVVLDQAVAGYRKATGGDPAATDPNSRQGRLLRAMMAAIVAATDEN